MSPFITIMTTVVMSSVFMTRDVMTNTVAPHFATPDGLVSRLPPRLSPNEDFIEQAIAETFKNK